MRYSRLSHLVFASAFTLSLILQHATCQVPLSTSQTRRLDGDPETEDFEYFQAGDDWTEHTCVKGKRQSPIDFPFFEEDIVSPMPRDYFSKFTQAAKRFLQGEETTGEVNHYEQIFKPLHLLTFEANYGEIADVQVKNLSDTVWIDIRHIDGDFIMHEENREDEVFRPLQFHFHAPSEHTIDGRHYDVEMHIYHVTEDKSHHSVVVVFFDKKAGGNEDNDFINSIFTTPKNESLENRASWVPVGVHIEELLLKVDRTKLFHYEGSLTVPPCTENVEWNIIDDPQPISDEQLAKFNNKWTHNKEFAGGRGNNRRTQSLNGRKIYYMAGHLVNIGIYVISISLLALYGMI